MLDQIQYLVRAGLGRQVRRLKRALLNAIEPRPYIASDKHSSINYAVSVIIPTLNGETDLVHLFPALRKQSGISALDIIVVDSGSQDATVALAKQYDARVIQLASGEFSHAYTRNLAAAQAQHPYLCFVVQDALPSKPAFLHNLCYALENNRRCAAVSCLEIPRSDADLFAIVTTLMHNEFMGVQTRDRLLRPPHSKRYISLRRNAQINNVACMMRRSTAHRYPFEGSYGEDLAFGLQLIGDGHSMALLRSTPVIHSHNRPAWYHLRRGYVGERMTLKTFADYPLPPISPRCFIANIGFALAGLSCMHHVLQFVNEQPLLHMLAFLQYFVSKPSMIYDVGHKNTFSLLEKLNPQLSLNLQAIIKTVQATQCSTNDQLAHNDLPSEWLLRGILGLLHNIEYYQGNEHVPIIKSIDTLWDYVIKAFGVHTGSMLASMVHHSFDDLVWGELDHQLRVGV